MLGATYCDEDGYITPPRNVAAYTAALVASGVVIAEGTRFTGLSPDGRTVRTSRGDITAGTVVLAGGPQLAAVGALAGIRVPGGGVRHHVAVTEEHPAFASTAMVFDVPSGLYWRPEEGGLLFGMSNPDEPPGDNREVDEGYLAKMRARLAALVPATAGLGLRRVWAATIDYTSDHMPIIGRAPGLEKVTVAGAAGAGMMWGPGLARAAADVALTGTSGVLDVSDLGLDRFDEAGRSRLATDPFLCPSPERITHHDHRYPVPGRRGRRQARGLGTAGGGPA
jgi:sarcosine oxidase subunit beta